MQDELESSPLLLGPGVEEKPPIEGEFEFFEEEDEELKKRIEEKAKRVRGLEEELERQRKRGIEIERARLEAELEELKAARRRAKKEYKVSLGKQIGKAWKVAKEVAGPRTPIRGWYTPRPQRELYAPSPPVETTKRQIGGVRKLVAPEMGMGAPTAQALTPHLGKLQRAGVPPPTKPIEVPFRDVERFEGLGGAMGRLRNPEVPFSRLRHPYRFSPIDQVVYAEIQANGDIDTPSHVRGQVSQLGFSRQEIDASLKKLRDLGLIIPTGRVFGREKELMVTGG